MTDARKKEIIVARKESIIKEKLIDDYVKLNADTDLQADLKELQAKATKMSNEELTKEIKLLLKLRDAQDQVNATTVFSIAYWKVRLQQFKEARENINLNEPGALGQIAGFDAQIEELEKFLSQFEKAKTKAKKEPFTIFFEMDLPTDSEFKKEIDDWWKNINDSMIEGFQQFKDIIGEQEDEFDAFGFDTFGIAANERYKNKRKDFSLGGIFQTENVPRKWVDEYKKLYGEDLSNWEEFLDTKVELSKEITDKIQEVTSQMFEIGVALYDREIENIEAKIEKTREYYDELYDLAEGDKEHQREIRMVEKAEIKKLEAERVRLEQKRAKLQKAQSITDALINTAVAITEVMPNPFLIALVSALGAAQVATILAQPIPQYAEGTDSHAGGLAIVGDGGRSEIVETSRGTFKTPSTSTLVNLERGAKVYPSERAYSDIVMKSLGSRASKPYEAKQIEQAIADGFKKAKVNNYLKLPKIDVKLDHQLWILKQTNWKS